MTPYVFISYSSVDDDNARALDAKLTALGVATFRDRKRIDLGDNFKAKISTGIERCTDLVLIASPSSLKSQWVFFEIGQAVALRRRIVTLRTHPGLDLPSFLSDFQFATTIEEVVEHFSRRLAEPAKPIGLRVLAGATGPNSAAVKLGPSDEMRQFLNRFPSALFHGHVAIDGAIELHTFPDQANPYGGVTQHQVTTSVTPIEWSEICLSGLSRQKIAILGAELCSWIGARRAKPNRIRFLLEPPAQMVLDNNEFRMRIGNSDYFTMRTVANLSRRSRETNSDTAIKSVFDTWWSAPGSAFPNSAVPYHISAQGVLFVSDPDTGRRYLVLTLPSRQRAPLVPSWNVTFAEQMWAPAAETPTDPWWKPYVGGLTIEAPKDRTGDRDVWNTVRRGLFEELGVQEQDLAAPPKLVASCIEQDMHFVAFIFVLQATLTVQDLYKRKLAAPDKEIGSIAAFPIEGPSDEGYLLDPARQLATLLSAEHFDGGPYLLPSPAPNVVEPWHLSSRLRIYAATRHLVGARLLDGISFDA